ncbi:MAG TPA: rod shape-determining protein MreC [Chitinophagaceae bacterium]|nr:rod shape-determining protein MreC [Chitinophagaceae bacterium]
MRNIFLFIRIYFNFLFFLFLMGIALFMLFNYNRFHHAVYSSAALEVTGYVDRKYNDVESYFKLKRTNDSLVKANTALYNKLRQDYNIPDTVSRLSIDTIQIDTLFHQRKYIYLPAEVTGNSVSQTNNYLVLHRGSSQGVMPDMAVTDVNNNVVGIVVDVSKNFSVAMSLLHRQSNISAKLKKTGETGSIIWDGVQPNIVILKDISKDVKITPGDSVITSGFSEIFPFGLLIGTVKDAVIDKSTGAYNIRVKTAANFYDVPYVNIINNLQKDEPGQLLKKVKKING